MQRPLLRFGTIVATPDFLIAIPRPAMIQGIKRHATDNRPVRDGQPILSDHAQGDRFFYLLTAADRQWTAIRLAEEV